LDAHKRRVFNQRGRDATASVSNRFAKTPRLPRVCIADCMRPTMSATTRNPRIDAILPLLSAGKSFQGDRRVAKGHAWSKATASSDHGCRIGAPRFRFQRRPITCGVEDAPRMCVGKINRKFSSTISGCLAEGVEISNSRWACTHGGFQTAAFKPPATLPNY